MEISAATVSLDHVVPVLVGGKTRRENIVAACGYCNSRKGSLTADEFRSKLNQVAAVKEGEQ